MYSSGTSRRVKIRTLVLRISTDLIGANFYPLIADGDRGKIRRKLELLTPEHPTFVDTHRSIAPDGSIGWQEWSDHATFDEADRLVEVQSVGREITERHEFEEELEAREQQYDAMFRASVTGVTVYWMLYP